MRSIAWCMDFTAIPTSGVWQEPCFPLSQYLADCCRTSKGIAVLRNLLIDTLQESLHAERQLVKATPRLAAAARDWQLRAAFEKHAQETLGHVDRLLEIFELLGVRAKAIPDKPVRSLIRVTTDAIAAASTATDADLADLALIGCAQKIGHYEVATYSFARAIAERLKLAEVAALIAQTEAEESRGTRSLARIAVPMLQRAAHPMSGGAAG